MTGRRLPLLVVLVVGFVAVVALVANGRPLAASSGHGGVSDSFWSWVLTTTIILFALVGGAVLVALFSGEMNFTKPQTSFVRGLLGALFGLVILGAAVGYLEVHFHHRLPSSHPPPDPGSRDGGHTTTDPNLAASSGAHFLWLEVLIVFGLLAAGVAVAVVYGRRNRESLPELTLAPEAVAEALDESLDDLRSDPDLRRAIVAAYARMENALRGVGLPRRPAEAPLEYLQRALETLPMSGPSVQRLTDLFEWAKFSHHEPEPAMRDEAVQALEAVRDELRAPVEAPAPVEVHL